MKTNSRIVYFDYLNVIAALGVVAMHSSMNIFNFKHNITWIFEAIINHLFYWAVPVFFMLSGATLIGFNERYSLKQYINKRTRRTVIPFLMWSVFGLIIGIFITRHIAPPQSLSQIISYFNAIFNTSIPGLSVYWFFIPLFAFYCCVPLFSYILGEKRFKIFSFLALYSFLTYSLLPDFLPYIGIKMNPNIQNPAAAGYLIYPLLGYLLAHHNFKPYIRNIVIISGILAFLTWLSYDIISSLRTNTLVFTNGFFRTPVVIISVSIFLFMKTINNASVVQHFAPPISSFSRLSFGVYMIHMFVITILMRTSLYQMSMWPLIAFLLAYSSSLIITKLLSTTPLLNRLV